MKRPIEDGVSLLVGAGIGVGLMYLLDPASGAARRERITRRASRVGEVSRNVLDHASRKAHDLRDAVRERVQIAGDEAVEHKDSMIDQARTLMGRVHLPALARARGRDRHSVGPALGAIGSLVIGAGIVWMFDPRLGRSRRAWLRDKSLKLARDTGELMNGCGRRLADHLRGTIATTRGKFGNEPISDEKLVARIRSAIGHVVPRMGDVQVTASDGHVTIVGQCEPSRASDIVTTIERIPGVRGVDNQLHGAMHSQSSPTGI